MKHNCHKMTKYNKMFACIIIELIQLINSEFFLPQLFKSIYILKSLNLSEA